MAISHEKYCIVQYITAYCSIWHLAFGTPSAFGLRSGDSVVFGTFLGFGRGQKQDCARAASVPSQKEKTESDARDDDMTTCSHVQAQNTQLRIEKTTFLLVVRFLFSGFSRSSNSHLPSASQKDRWNEVVFRLVFEIGCGGASLFVSYWERRDLSYHGAARRHHLLSGCVYTTTGPARGPRPPSRQST